MSQENYHHRVHGQADLREASSSTNPCLQLRGKLGFSYRKALPRILLAYILESAPLAGSRLYCLCILPHPTSPIPPTPPLVLGVFLNHFAAQWPTMIYFANDSHSPSPHMGMPCGIQVQRERTGPWKSATSVSYAGANSTVFSTLCFLRMIHPTNTVCRNIMNHLSPSFQIISTRVLLVVAITVRVESA